MERGHLCSNKSSLWVNCFPRNPNTQVTDTEGTTAQAAHMLTQHRGHM